MERWEGSEKKIRNHDQTLRYLSIWIKRCPQIGSDILGRWSKVKAVKGYTTAKVKNISTIHQFIPLSLFPSCLSPNKWTPFCDPYLPGLTPAILADVISNTASVQTLELPGNGFPDSACDVMVHCPGPSRTCNHGSRLLQSQVTTPR
ncbi:hypothetical protein RRG08_009568 [Elysia crispata]|uniref:Uncharacterized protein n=1 Tax=Elysia crispata TaxID=231223 RepID=A0AAE0ZIA4_9GAST|nr:hypothetical protein RRG08_009568 [Elysia crispata]